MTGRNYEQEVSEAVGKLFDTAEREGMDEQLFLDALIDTLAQLFCEEFLGFPEDIDSLLHDIAIEIAELSWTEPAGGIPGEEREG